MCRLFILIVCFFAYSSIAQNFCGTATPHFLPSSLSQLKEDSDSTLQARLEEDTIYLPLQIHLVTTNTGLHADEAAILQGIEVLNLRFRSMRIQFVRCKAFHYIQSDEFSSLDNESESTKLITTYNNLQTIDIFYVNEVTYGDICGFASIGWVEDGYIVLKKGCENNGSLEHEMGHYFSLLHTHETAYGTELVNGSNCSASGDLICDTPADPDLQNEVVPGNCKYNNPSLKDANGDVFTPLADNIMSYAPRSCTKSFTEGQIIRMNYFYEHITRSQYTCTDKVDFTVSLLLKAADFTKGQTNEIRIVVENTSAYEYTGPLSYAVYLEDSSRNKIFLSTGNFSLSLSSQMRDTVSFLVDVPRTIPKGVYHLTAVIDPDDQINESNENNNTFRKQIGFFANGGLLPDLIVHYTGPASHTTGELFEVQLEFKNMGNARSGYFAQDLYLSEDNNLDKSDLSLGKLWVEELEINQTFTQTLQTGLPITKNGYIIACADAMNNVEELDENNNCLIARILNVPSSINSPKPDYAITSHWINGVVGDTLRSGIVAVSFSIDNFGIEQNDTRLYTGFYLSKDPYLSTEDLFMNYGMGGSGTPMHFTLPQNIPKANYYVIAKVDFRNYIAESKENNNVYAWQVYVNPLTAPDLQLRNPSLSDYNWSEYNIISVNGEIKNLGAKQSGPWGINVYLRQDSLRLKFPFYPFLDPVFYSPVDSTALLPGQQKNKTFSFRIGKQLAPGKYFAAVCVTPSNNTKESEEDNCYVFEQPVVIRSSFVAGMEKDSAVSLSEIILFPNPSEGEVVICGDQIDLVTIFSQDGRTTSKTILNNRINIRGISPGVYTVQVVGSMKSYFKKLVVK